MEDHDKNLVNLVPRNKHTKRSANRGQTQMMMSLKRIEIGNFFKHIPHIL